MLETLKDVLKYFKARKKIWLLPLVLIIVFTGILLIFGSATGLAPFIYSLF